jgi:hypothetical protein
MKTTPTRSRTMPSNEDVLSQVRSLLESPEDDVSAVLVKEILVGMLKLHDAHLEPLDLKIVNRAIKELRHAFRVFRDYHHRKKSAFSAPPAQCPMTQLPDRLQFLPTDRRRRLHGHYGRADGIMRAAQRVRAARTASA